ncbi:PREDICTED: protein lifeguard 2-like [Crocodylus porosus]|uniref:protein lifeguard 2-like n=1 Tax=Crocodylus porosus TaxID=8502 RepID=UPI00093BF41F|nr:PREDICTED: protein lifeguard 2-like [Crocodylus porosus]
MVCKKKCYLKMERNKSANYPGAGGELPYNKSQYQGKGFHKSNIGSRVYRQPLRFMFLNVENLDVLCSASQHQATGEGMTNACLAAVHDKSPAYQSPMEESSQFSNRAIRQGKKRYLHAFVRKVHLILTVQLAVTAGIICTFFIYWRRLKEWVLMNSWFSCPLFPAIFILAVVLSCCDNAHRKFPLNFILLAIFTVLKGLMLGSTSALFDADAVMWAIGATTFLTLGLSIFAPQTKWDFTIATGILLAVVLPWMLFGIPCAILPKSFLSVLHLVSCESLQYL